MLITLPHEGLPRIREEKRRRWKEDGAEAHGLEKAQVIRDLIAGE